MYRILVLLVVTVFFTTNIEAQRSLNFNLIAPAEKFQKSEYNTFEYLDSRLFTKNLGETHSGQMGGYNMKDATPMETQIISLLEKAIPESASDKTLLIQLRKFMFSDEWKRGVDDTPNKCLFRASYYQKHGDNYFHIATLDTLVEGLQAQIAVRASAAIEAQLREVVQLLPDLSKEPLAIRDVKNIAAIERKVSELFTATSLPDGIYTDFKSLRLLQPSITEFVAEKKDDELKSVTIPHPDKPGKEKKMKPKEVYAIVKDGLLYIAYEGRFYPTFKEGGKLKFKAAISDNVKKSMISSQFGLMGALMSEALVKDKYLIMSFDHFDGEFIFEENVK